MTPWSLTIMVEVLNSPLLSKVTGINWFIITPILSVFPYRSFMLSVYAGR
jgi:hypothetical protein